LAGGITEAFVLGRVEPTLQMESSEEEFAEPRQESVFNILSQENVAFRGQPLSMEESIDFIRGSKIVRQDAFNGLIRRNQQWGLTSVYLTEEMQLQTMKDLLLDELGAQGIAELDPETFRVTGEMTGRMDFDNFLRRWKDEAMPNLTTGAVELIFEQQMLNARAAADWVGANEKAHKKMVQAGRYVTAADDRVRPEHAVWHGSLHPLNSSFWSNWWPPNGFRCRCDVIFVYKWEPLAEAIRDGKTNSITKAEAKNGFSTGKLAEFQNVYFAKDPGLKVAVIATKSGRVYDFNQNVGKLYQRQQWNKLSGATA